MSPVKKTESINSNISNSKPIDSINSSNSHEKINEKKSLNSPNSIESILSSPISKAFTKYNNKHNFKKNSNSNIADTFIMSSSSKIDKTKSNEDSSDSELFSNFPTRKLSFSPDSFPVSKKRGSFSIKEKNNKNLKKSFAFSNQDQNILLPSVKETLSMKNTQPINSALKLPTESLFSNSHLNISNQPKKLKIKNTKFSQLAKKEQLNESQSSTNKISNVYEKQNTQASYLLEKYFDQSWEKLNDSIDSIFSSKPISYSLEILYQSVENISRSGKSSELWELTVKKFKLYIQSMFSTYEQNYYSSDDFFLQDVVENWKRFTQNIIQIRNIFFYLDRSFLLCSRTNLPIWETCIKLVRIQYENHQSIKSRLFSGMDILFQKCRDDSFESCCVTTQAESFNILIDAVKLLLTLNIYNEYFYDRFIDNLLEYYTNFAAENIGNSIAQYTSQVIACFDFEFHNPITHYYTERTRLYVKKTLESVLIKKQVNPLIGLTYCTATAETNKKISEYLLKSTGAPFPTLSEVVENGKSPYLLYPTENLTNLKFSSVLELGTLQSRLDSLFDTTDYDTLKSIYDLFGRVNARIQLIAPWVSFIMRHGLDLVLYPENDSAMIQNLLDFKGKLDSIITKSFKIENNNQTDDSQLMGQALRMTFEFFINKRKDVPAERIARYLDSILRNGNKGIDERQLIVLMDRLLDLFRFINGKDMFEAFYKRDLAKRLLLNKSSSVDAERNMISKLKSECGIAFTNRLEEMFKDIEVSKDFMTSYREGYNAFSGNSLSKQQQRLAHGLFVNVLSQGNWPTYPDSKVILPREMTEELDRFKKFYLSKQSGRAISWRHSLDYCILKADFPLGKHELYLSLFQTVVLLLFNDESLEENGHKKVQDSNSNFKLSYAQIKNRTGLEDHELKRTLQSLACAKYRVLNKIPRGREVSSEDSFELNNKFEAKMYRVKINQIQASETETEKTYTVDKVQRDRKYEIQAAIIRIMKARKIINHADLVREVISQTIKRGTLQSSEIKKNIERLIEKDYIERQGRDTYTYEA